MSGSIAISQIMNFTYLMQSIHFVIGIAEGLVTAGIVVFAKFVDSKKLSYLFGLISLLLAGVISQYASQKPDGLEWSLLNISESVVMQTQGVLYNMAESIQAKSSVFLNLPFTFGSIAGLLLVIVIMFSICHLINIKTVKENAE